MSDKRTNQRMLWVIVWDIGAAAGLPSRHRYVNRHELTGHDTAEEGTLYASIGEAMSAMRSIGTKGLHLESVWVDGDYMGADEPGSAEWYERRGK